MIPGRAVRRFIRHLPALDGTNEFVLTHFIEIKVGRTYSSSLALFYSIVSDENLNFGSDRSEGDHRQSIHICFRC